MTKGRNADLKRKRDEAMPPSCGGLRDEPTGTAPCRKPVRGDNTYKTPEVGSVEWLTDFRTKEAGAAAAIHVAHNIRIDAGRVFDTNTGDISVKYDKWAKLASGQYNDEKSQREFVQGASLVFLAQWSTDDETKQ